MERESDFNSISAMNFYADHGIHGEKNRIKLDEIAKKAVKSMFEENGLTYNQAVAVLHRCKTIIQDRCRLTLD